MAKRGKGSKPGQGDSGALQARLAEIRNALQRRKLPDGEKLRLFMTDEDIAGVADAISGEGEVAEHLLMDVAKETVWASTFAHINRELNSPSGRPADYHLFAIVSTCCDFWKESEGHKLRFSRPHGGGEAGGPLIRFICLVHKALLGQSHDAKFETIADHIKRIKKGNTTPFDPLRDL